MKGFKKDGKFRPTGKKSKSPLKKSDVRRKRNDIFSGSSSTGLPIAPQVMPNEEPNWRDFTEEKDNPFVNPDTSSFTPSENPKEEKGDSVFFKLGKFAGKLDKVQNKIEKKKNQEKIAEQRLESIIDSSIDKILDDRGTTNEQKFRLLQRFAVQNKESLLERQLEIINKSLKVLEAESINPQTFIGASQPNQKTSSFSSRITGIGAGSGIGVGVNKNVIGATKKPITLLSGQKVIPTSDEIALNRLRQGLHNTVNPLGSVVPQTTTTTTTTSTSTPDNLGAEINAILGK